MSGFTDGLSIMEQGPDSDVWQILGDLHFDVGFPGSGVFIVIPAGFVSDGASIPYPLDLIWPRWGRRYRRPATLHDYLYRLGRAGTPHLLAQTRRSADAHFADAMAVCGTNVIILDLFWAAVRIFGPRW